MNLEHNAISSFTLYRFQKRLAKKYFSRFEDGILLDVAAQAPYINFTYLLYYLVSINKMDTAIEKVDTEGNTPLHSCIFQNYANKSKWHNELIARTAQLIAMKKFTIETGVEELDEQLKDLLDYYEDFFLPACKEHIFFLHHENKVFRQFDYADNPHKFWTQPLLKASEQEPVYRYKTNFSERKIREGSLERLVNQAEIKEHRDYMEFIFKDNELAEDFSHSIFNRFKIHEKDAPSDQKEILRSESDNYSILLTFDEYKTISKNLQNVQRPSQMTEGDSKCLVQ